MQTQPTENAAPAGPLSNPRINSIVEKTVIAVASSLVTSIVFWLWQTSRQVAEKELDDSFLSKLSERLSKNPELVKKVVDNFGIDAKFESLHAKDIVIDKSVRIGDGITLSAGPEPELRMLSQSGTSMLRFLFDDNNAQIRIATELSGKGLHTGKDITIGTFGEAGRGTIRVNEVELTVP